MTDHPTLRPGQRIRVALEGIVEELGSSGNLQLRTGESRYYIQTPDGQPDGLLAYSESTVEVLAEPRPDEPEGLGAVVKAHTSVHPERRLMYRTERGHWWDFRKGAVRDWADLTDPVVLNEGWTEGRQATPKRMPTPPPGPGSISPSPDGTR